MNGVLLILSFCSLALLLDCGSVDAQSRDYFIGNSLTDNILTGRALERAAAGTANPLQTSQHIRCNSSLTATIAAVSDPTQTGVCVATGDAALDLGEFPNAFQQDFDRLILQPFFGASLQEEINSIKTFIDTFRANPDNANDQVYIYASWGLQEDFLSTWNNHSATLAGPFIQSASTYRLLLSTLEQDGYEVDVIPAGQAFANLGEQLETASVGNLTDISDLYRDTIHGSNAGRYLGVLTAYLALSRDSVENVTLDHTAFPFNLDETSHGITLNDEAAAGLRQIASQLFSAGFPAQELTSNGDFETGDTTGWQLFLSESGGFTVDSVSSFDGGFNGRVENTIEASSSVVKQANVGIGTVIPSEAITVSFWARGSGEAGGVHFAELFSELDGGGVSKSEILGGGPLFPPSDTDWTFYSFETTVGEDVAGGVTLQFNAATGANPGSISTLEIDNVSILVATAPTMIGDVNLDGVTNFADIRPFIAILFSGTFQAEADCDQNGVVNFVDIPPLIVILASS